jgi:hypothetical protein
MIVPNDNPIRVKRQLRWPKWKRPNLWLFALELSLTTASPAHAIPVAVIAAAIGAAATSFIAIAVTFVVNAVLSFGLSLLINAIVGKPNPQRQAAIVTLAIGEQPRVAILGKAAVAGTLCDAFNWGGQYGTDWECVIIALADHYCEGLTGIYVNDQLIPYPSGGFSGGTVPDQTVTGTQVISGSTVTTTGTVKYNGQLQIWFLNGAASQTLPSVVANGGWSTTGNFSGIALAVCAYKADDPQATDPVWSGGRPTFLFVVKGKRLYDPRYDSTVAGGSGAQRWTDPTTWTWSTNPIVARYNWARGIFANDAVSDPTQLLLGRGLSAIEAPPANVAAYANICDEAVALKAGGTEPRYSVGGVVLSTDKFAETEKMFADCMAGIVLQSSGSVEVEPGHARSATFTITDNDLIVGSQVSFAPFRSVADNAWANTVVAGYIEPTQKWQQHSAPVRRVSADVTADGATREISLALPFVTSNTQAQRCAEIQRRLGRLVRAGQITLGPRFLGIEEGDWGTWTSARYLGGATVTFRVEGYQLNEKRQITLTIREIASTVYNWTASTDEAASDITRTPVLPISARYQYRYGSLGQLNGQLVASSYALGSNVLSASA